MKTHSSFSSVAFSAAFKSATNPFPSGEGLNGMETLANFLVESEPDLLSDIAVLRAAKRSDATPEAKARAETILRSLD